MLKSMYMLSGRLGHEAQRSLARKIAHVSMSGTLLDDCRVFVEKDQGRTMFGRLLGAVLPYWLKSSAFWGETACLADGCPEAVALPGENIWSNVDWNFPDQAIAEVMGVSRQAVAQRRAGRLDPAEVGEPGLAPFEAIARAREKMVAEELGISESLAMMARTMSVALLRPKLEMLPDVPDSGERLAEIMKSDKNGGNPPDALQWVSAVKGVGPFAAARLILAAMPVQSHHDGMIETAAGLPDGALAAMRKLEIDWRKRLSSIPDKRPSLTDDPLYEIAERKDISPAEAARLMWVVLTGEEADKIAKTLEKK